MRAGSSHGNFAFTFKKKPWSVYGFRYIERYKMQEGINEEYRKWMNLNADNIKQ